MSPLETLAALVVKHGHAEWATELRSLVAREEMRPEGFWEDVASARLWGREGDSLACLELAADADHPGADTAAFRSALFALADDLALRGVASADSAWWADRLKP